MMATTDTNNNTLEAYRVATLEELGFSKEEAEKLSASFYSVTVGGKDKNSVARTYLMRVDHHYVRKMLDRGATREQVIAALV
jgi:Holliday junction resolvasome RuvABC DNA-binding subunit